VYLLAIGLIGVSLQIWQVLHESRQSVQLLYVIVVIGFVVAKHARMGEIVRVLDVGRNRF
jgi:hypothetical protein